MQAVSPDGVFCSRRDASGWQQTASNAVCSRERERETGGQAGVGRRTQGERRALVQEARGKWSAPCLVCRSLGGSTSVAALYLTTSAQSLLLLTLLSSLSSPPPQHHLSSLVCDAMPASPTSHSFSIEHRDERTLFPSVLARALSLGVSSCQTHSHSVRERSQD